MISAVATLFAVTLVLGAPIAFAMGIAALYYLYQTGQPMILKLVPQMMVAGMDTFPLLAIPFFILAGEIMNRTKITLSLVEFAQVLVGHLRGGLAHVAVVASIIFAGISGSAVADAAAIGSILVPAMVEDKYDKKFAAALTAAASVVGPIIPPSIIAVIYSYTMNVSVAGLFAAGVIPGLLIGLALMVASYFISVKRGYPKHEFSMTPSKVIDATRKAFLALLMPLIILGGILSGVFTATEAAAVAVGYALVVGFFVTKNIKLRDLPSLFLGTATTSSVVFLMIGTSSILQWVLARENVGQLVGQFFAGFATNPYLLLFIINIIFLIAGMFIDTSPAILLFAPILAPIAIQAGVHPLHMGIITEVNLAIGLATPPVGATLFVTSGVTKTPFEDLISAIWPLILIEIAILYLITYVPSLTLYLPRVLGYV